MLTETDLFPISLDDLERRLRDGSFRNDQIAWGYWADYIWDADVFMPPDGETGEEMWERVGPELEAMIGGEHELNPEQAWMLASAAFGGCDAELHERLWPQGDDAFLEALRATSLDERLLARPFIGLHPPSAGNLTPSVRQEVSFGWLRNEEIRQLLEDLPEVESESWNELRAMLEHCSNEGKDLFVAADGRI